jgi:hypothetical protein
MHMMNDDSRPLSAAQIHSIYRDGLSVGDPGQVAPPAYRRSTFSTREPSHPGSPPPRPSPSPKSKRR